MLTLCSNACSFSKLCQQNPPRPITGQLRVQNGGGFNWYWNGPFIVLNLGAGSNQGNGIISCSEILCNPNYHKSLEKCPRINIQINIDYGG